MDTTRYSAVLICSIELNLIESTRLSGWDWFLFVSSFIMVLVLAQKFSSLVIVTRKKGAKTLENELSGVHPINRIAIAVTILLFSVPFRPLLSCSVLFSVEIEWN